MTSATDPVIVLIASRGDPAAASFAERAGGIVRVMTPADLSQPGWTFDASGAGPSMAVIAGKTVPSTAIIGVVTRLAVVTEQDLPHIIVDDRSYVAAEMTAFLLAWLTSLPCPVVNRPSPQCLSGPHWRLAQWRLAANRLGIPTVPTMLRASRTTPQSENDAQERDGTTSIVVVGRHHVGTVDPVLVAYAHALAHAAGVELLSAWFDGDGPSARFVGASLWPDLGDARVSDAVLRLMCTRAAEAGNLREAV
ncbi:conserved hypothetical protein [Bradyrhizobium sp. ORS 278]|uniref:hypothetical protein n=1 Tax=Bradyrhizobium sp. (strain ORS 278) TaxID=114615 RepID=UPI000150814F|nr:hypothetical protein [Bradyrhizobium sp. ORS 278]CAL78117.1 conserved hypothetical protein [Bradyrhizobium sp. ORS 278]